MRPRMKAACLQGLMLLIAVAFPQPANRAFPGTECSNPVTQSGRASPPLGFRVEQHKSRTLVSMHALSTVYTSYYVMVYMAGRSPGRPAGRKENNRVVPSWFMGGNVFQGSMGSRRCHSVRQLATKRLDRFFRPRGPAEWFALTYRSIGGFSSPGRPASADASGPWRACGAS